DLRHPPRERGDDRGGPAGRHRHRPAARRERGHPGDPGGLHPPLRPAALPALVHRGRRRLGPGRHRLPRRLRHRREHRHRLRHHQRAVGHRGLRRRDLPDRVPGRLLRRPLQPRPRPDHPGQRVRVLRLGGQQRHLRDLHLHLLRPRGLDHGPGPRGGPRGAAVGGVRGLHGRHLPAGRLRHEGAHQAAAVDDAALAGAHGGAVRLPGRRAPGVGHLVLRLPGRERAGRAEPRLGDAGRRRLPVPDRPDRGADRLPALHAAADAGELAPLVAGDDPRRPGLGDLRRGQAGHRAVPRRLPHRERGRRRRRGQPAGAPVPRDLPRHHAGAARARPRRRPRRHQPGQDQRDERLLRLVGLDQLLHPRDQALPGTAGLPRRQPAHRAGADGGEHVRLPQHHPRLLRQLRDGLDRHRRLRHHLQQVPAEAQPPAAGVPPRDALRRQPRRLRLDARGGRRLDPRVLRRSGGRDSALLAAGGHRPRPGPAARAGRGDPRPLLPAPGRPGRPAARRRRPGPARAGRARQPIRRPAHLPRLPAGLRTARHGRLPDPRGGGLLAVPQHRQGRRPRAARPARSGL
ncbi:MAG: Putative transmembrane protein, partial [uncultured Friedmanniella sp.]